MSKLPKLAIVGRPNVGKSAIFNQICKKKISIVDDAEGITRDRLYADADFFGQPFQVIDTGGIDARSKLPFNEEVKRQAEIAIEEADTLVMVVDSRSGLTALDHEVAQILLRAKKPLCLAVNKIDNSSEEYLIHDFHPLGIKNIIAVSAAQGWHIAELLEAAFAPLPKFEPIETIPTIKIAIVGRPNVGKSSLLNYMLNEDRCIVSPIPGTTRDSVDVLFTHEGQQYTLIDTAGIRRKHAEHEVVDKFAAIRTERAIARCDVCFLMLDSVQGMTTQEKKIATTIEEEGKGCILVFNKWDLVKGIRMEHCLRALQESVPFLQHCPALFISAKTGRNVEKLLPEAKRVYEGAKLRIPTPQLNSFIEAALQRNHPPMIQGKRLRIYYMTQIGIEPPEFILFVNYPNLMLETYQKYLYNQFREKFGFSGVPIVLRLKGKRRAEGEAGAAKANSKINTDQTELAAKQIDTNNQDNDFVDDMDFEEMDIEELN